VAAVSKQLPFEQLLLYDETTRCDDKWRTTPLGARRYFRTKLNLFCIRYAEGRKDVTQAVVKSIKCNLETTGINYSSNAVKPPKYYGKPSDVTMEKDMITIDSSKNKKVAN